MFFKNIEIGTEFVAEGRQFMKFNEGLGRASSQQELSKHLYQAFLPDSIISPYPFSNVVKLNFSIN